MSSMRAQIPIHALENKKGREEEDEQTRSGVITMTQAAFSIFTRVPFQPLRG